MLRRDDHLMTKRSDLPRELGTQFAVADARRAGVSADRLTALDLRAPFRGVRTALVPIPPGLTRYELRDHELRELCAAYLPVAPTDAAFSHLTAARLYGMPVPERLIATELHVSTADQPPRRRGIRSHELADTRRRIVSGLPLVVPERAWLQLAPLISLDELIVAGDHLVRRKKPLCTPDSLAQEIARCSGARGIAKARSAFGQLRSGTDSPPESWMRLTIVRAGYPEPVVGYRAHNDGAFIGTPDLSYPRYRIAYEYQGGGHREADEFENDIFRLDEFHLAQWEVIQVTKKLLWQPGWLAERTRRALISRGWTTSTQL